MSRIPHTPVSRPLQSVSRRRFTINLATLTGIALATIPATAQAPPHPAPAAQIAPKKAAFEVASIRLEGSKSTVDYNDPAKSYNQPQKFPANRLVMTHIMMISLICEAYAVDCGNVVGLPALINSNSTHYDLSAKVEGDKLLTFEQMRPMLQTLLEERFHLVVHREHKIVPGYGLVIAQSGPKVQPNKGAPFMGIGGAAEIKFQNTSIEDFARIIANKLKKPVADKTGLKGMYDVDLKFAPPTGPFQDDPRFANLPNIFTAVQEQLGLKLMPLKVPQDYLVVDHVDRMPIEN